MKNRDFKQVKKDTVVAFDDARDYVSGIYTVVSRSSFSICHAKSKQTGSVIFFGKLSWYNRRGFIVDVDSREE
jgi:hypothetical protein